MLWLEKTRPSARRTRQHIRSVYPNGVCMVNHFSKAIVFQITSALVVFWRVASSSSIAFA